uniref:ABC transporter ATP-binding protein n=1 Tax=Candidatus Methanomethylicus mesodigestus TaxID=1867258 RepID=A0A7C3IX07_9CREN
MLLSVEGLVKDYRESGIRALDSVTFSIEEGEIVGIIGESGAGKSTLLRVLRGVEEFDGGVVRFQDLTVMPTSPKDDFLRLQKQTAIQLQRSFGIWPETAADNIIRAIRYSEFGEESIPEDEGEYNEYKERAIEILKAVGLDERADLWAEIMSGGEKQRLIVARQVARKPKLLLLDEPGTMSCPSTREALIDALKMANKRFNMSILFASHNPEIHRSLAKRTLLLSRGRIINDGHTEDVLRAFLSRMEDPIMKVSIGGPVVLKLEGVTKDYTLIPYGKVFELKGTDLKFRRGEITAIVGPSGAGKTIILRMLAGLELPDSGEVKMIHRGEWVTLGKLGRRSLHARRHIGMLHQEFDLPHWAKIIDLFAARIGIKDYSIVEEALRRAKRSGISEETVDALHRVAELPDGEMQAKLEQIGLNREILNELFRKKDPVLAQRVATTALEAVGLSTDFLERHVYELSGGEKIRVALALALISSPKLIVLDEPFGDLDPLTLRLVANSLKMVKSKLKPSIVLVSHQLDFVEEVADRAILIVEGRVITDGDPSEVIRRFCEVE